MPPSTLTPFPVVLVVHGLGDQYAESPPWATSLETSVRTLQRNVTRLYYQSAPTMHPAQYPPSPTSTPAATNTTSQTNPSPTASALHHQALAVGSAAALDQQTAPSLHPHPSSAAAEAPPVLILPLEYHSAAQAALSAALAPHLPANPASSPVREGIQETLGDVLIAASPTYRALVADVLLAQIHRQIAAVHRARPDFPSARTTILAHSTGAVFALDILQKGLLDSIHGLETLILVGSPAAAFATFDQNFAVATRNAILARKRAGTLRVYNVYHPLDPVAYRLAPFLAAHSHTAIAGDQPSSSEQTLEETTTSTAAAAAIAVPPPPVEVGHFDRPNIWEGAASFWDDAVQNVLSALFPGRKVSPGDPSPPLPTINAVAVNREVTEASPPAPEGGAQEGTPVEVARPFVRPRQSLRGTRSYLIRSANPDEEPTLAGVEVLLGDYVDFELQDTTGTSSIDVVSNWAAVQAHGFYWRSTEIARIIVDVTAATRGSSGASRARHKLSSSID